MPLTDLELKRAKPREKPYKLTDGQGLHVLIKPTGSKYFHFDFKFDGKRGTTSFGVYPDVSLAVAREQRSEWRRLLAEGIDPRVLEKDAEKASARAAANSFEIVAREWFAKQALRWVPSHADRILSRLERDILPWLGPRPIAGITAGELLKCLERIEGRSPETARRALSECRQIFRYAVVTQRMERDVSADLQGALKPVMKKHFPAITGPAEASQLLRALHSYRGSIVTECALRLAPLVFVRPGELRKAEWSHIDLDIGEWRFISSKTKTPHIVPLAKQAVEILRDLHPVTGREPYVFAGPRTKRPISDNTLLQALRSLGIEKDKMTIHGFRAMARTIMDEELDFRPDLIEHQLAHKVHGPLGRAYNRTSHLAKRKEMMQRWADYLDTLRTKI
ncbi:integrase arm-type DNA-binding domain-containing protein [Pseudoduganella sp. SL102]|uniref:tyrosine-type recombinase/integrase n=1 Tax=Pseudoduganella sp. SL102 TaxID=2995154 RepID=UPI00248CFD91|nr:integrase arm-type DNA-binding domain-containing protein [Pseudoduganella sp. SL102]WBS00082.1 integrase arm-type DNA-binding domain-containing protein [Pseudoduganella sp. SL102]